jgi:hypothetical protein
MIIRWLGAFGKTTSLEDAGVWEYSQTERQVAAEPLFHGRSLIAHVKIGLEIDTEKSIFASGWMTDAYTVIGADGVLRTNRNYRGKMNRFRKLDRFLAVFNRHHQGNWHGECAFAAPVYRAVVVKRNASAHGMARAVRLAGILNLPLKEILP